MSDPVVVGGRYQLATPLGNGGMAAVRVALDLRLGRWVAVKRPHSALAADSSAREGFQHEAWTAARLNHPNIVQVFDTGDEPDPETGINVPYLVMEWVHGETLRSRLRREGPLSPDTALRLTRKVLAALAHSHEAGVVHCDIKPSNVMVTASDGIKVMDFGISREMADAGRLPGPPAVLGTAKYLSPERACGEPHDARSDLYSTGCLLYELLVGRAPFTGRDRADIIEQHLAATPPRPSEQNPSIGPDVDRLVTTALAKHPHQRYQSAREMSAAIGAVLLAGQSEPLWEPAARTLAPARRRPTRVLVRQRLTIAAAGLLIILLPVGGYATYTATEGAGGRRDVTAAAAPARPPQDTLRPMTAQAASTRTVKPSPLKPPTITVSTDRGDAQSRRRAAPVSPRPSATLGHAGDAPDRTPI